MKFFNKRLDLSDSEFECLNAPADSFGHLARSIRTV